MSEREADLSPQDVESAVGDNGGNEPVCKKPRSDHGEHKQHARVEPIPGRCEFFLQRKKRYCRTIPPEGQKYCVEHSHVLGEATGRKRVPCPLDPKHSCYEDQLKKHLKKCNAREDLQPIYFMRNINSGEVGNEDYRGITIRTVDTEEVFKMIDLVKKLYSKEVNKLEEEILCHRALHEELEKPFNGVAAQKHLKQQASLVGHVEKMGFLKNNQCFVEFGAGKGLSHWIQRGLDRCDETQFVLVDKSSVRYKMDVYHRGEEQGPSFERLRIDIEHLSLDKVPSLNHYKPIIGVGKHLCGGATDLMVRCLMNTVHSKQDDNDTNQKERYVKGLVLALCCHHRCDWQSYVGKEFFQMSGLNGRDFHIIASMTSWATCGTRPSQDQDLQTEETRTVEHSLESCDEEEVKAGYNHPRYGSLTPEEREEIGFMCKKLIDTGRCRYLQSHGFDAHLVLYTKLSLSLENVVLLAVRQDCVANICSDDTKR